MASFPDIKHDKIWPRWAVAVIVAIEHISDCDPLSEHYNVITGPMHLIAWSKTKKDLFPEMRIASAWFNCTAHLESADDRVEHREKYRDGTGGGYYLKDGGIYDDGWIVKKIPLGIITADDVILAMRAGRYCICPPCCDACEQAADYCQKDCARYSEYLQGIQKTVGL